MSTIKQYPKLSLMIYEAIKPYIQIFDNDYLSFVDLCTKNRLINLDVLKIMQINDKNNDPMSSI